MLGLPVETIEEALALKSYGYLRMAQLVIPFMRRTGWGRIVNVAGAAGTSPERGNLPVSLANIAVLNMTRALSDAVAGDGILVNTICPGLTNTTRARRLHATRAAEEGRDVDELIAEAGRGLPAGTDRRTGGDRGGRGVPRVRGLFLRVRQLRLHGRRRPPRNTVNDMDTGIRPIWGWS